MMGVPNLFACWQQSIVVQSACTVRDTMMMLGQTSLPSTRHSTPCPCLQIARTDREQANRCLHPLARTPPSHQPTIIKSDLSRAVPVPTGNSFPDGTFNLDLNGSIKTVVHWPCDHVWFSSIHGHHLVRWQWFCSAIWCCVFVSIP